MSLAMNISLLNVMDLEINFPVSVYLLSSPEVQYIAQQWWVLFLCFIP